MDLRFFTQGVLTAGGNMLTDEKLKDLQDRFGRILAEPWGLNKTERALASIASDVFAEIDRLKSALQAKTKELDRVKLQSVERLEDAICVEHRAESAEARIRDGATCKVSFDAEFPVAYLYIGEEKFEIEAGLFKHNPGEVRKARIVLEDEQCD
jgi:hypothetical protein